MSDANKIQHGGDHYKSSVQHWDVMADFFGIDYHIGCATKYLSRWQKKGTPLLDLQKSIHFTDKAIEVVLGNPAIAANNEQFVPRDVIERFVIANDLEMHERLALLALWRWDTVEDLMQAKVHIQAIIREFEHAQSGPSEGKRAD